VPAPAPRARPQPVLEIRLPTRALLPGNTDRDVWTSVLVDGWVAACRFTMQEGRLVIAELRCVPHAPKAPHLRPGLWTSVAPVPAGGLTKRWLDRALAIGDHLRAATAAVRDAQRHPRGSVARDVQEWLLGAMVESPLAPRSHPRGRGRPPLDEALLLRVAVEYDRAATRDPHHVNRLVAARLKLPPSRVRALVHQARNKGFLTKTHQGVPDGKLTLLARQRLSTRSARRVRATTTKSARRTAGRRRHRRPA
jgi:hypothetical protein